VVQTDINGGDPCSSPSLAATKASEVSSGRRSGSVRANMNKLFTVPLPMLNGLTTPFAMRREGDGSATDLSWRDSYVRVTLTKLVTFSSDGVTHLTSGSIVILGVTDFVVGGPIAAFSYLSLLDATLNMVHYQLEPQTWEGHSSHSIASPRVPRIHAGCSPSPSSASIPHRRRHVSNLCLLSSGNDGLNDGG
jgi:hypothetical protein